MELVVTGMVSSDVAGLMWALAVRRMPITVIAAYASTGKTTFLRALTSLLPSGIRRLPLRGSYENFGFIGEPSIIPCRTAVMINEISPYLPAYLWGPAVRRALRLSRRGFAVYATAHAESISELIDLLASWPLRVPPRDIAALGTIVEIDAWPDLRGPLGIRRQVAGCHGLRLVNETGELEMFSLARRLDRTAPLTLYPTEIVNWSRHSLLPGEQILEESGERSRCIAKMVARNLNP